MDKYAKKHKVIIYSPTLTMAVSIKVSKYKIHIAVFQG